MEKPPITNSEEINGFSPSHRWDLQPTSDQFTGKIDRVRQNETLASVRHPQPPLTNLNRMEYFNEILHAYTCQHCLTTDMHYSIFDGRGFAEHQL